MGVDNLKNFRSWEKVWLETVEHQGKKIYLLVQGSTCYGELITKFQIGETPQTTTVPSRYGDQLLPCSEQNSLLGIRAFEEDSITYEFLWKPLGLKIPEKKKQFTRRGRFLQALQNS